MTSYGRHSERRKLKKKTPTTGKKRCVVVTPWMNKEKGDSVGREVEGEKQRCLEKVAGSSDLRKMLEGAFHSVELSSEKDDSR